MRKVLDTKQKLFSLLLHNATDEGKKVFEHLEHDVVQAWQELVTHAPGGRIGSASVDLSSDSFELEERDGAHFGWAARCC